MKESLLERYTDDNLVKAFYIGLGIAGTACMLVVFFCCFCALYYRKKANSGNYVDMNDARARPTSIARQGYQTAGKGDTSGDRIEMSANP
jgi:hypothetical protein